VISRHPDPKVQAAIDVEADRVAASWPELTDAELADLARIYAPINEAERVATKPSTRRPLRRAA
jgi:hypothetical protein